ncbi:trans-sialidase, putative [Trypanosoma cruzi]|nr:trans-sialidase, putative [Trypanosoma cruzi]
MLSRVAAVMAPRTHNRRRVTGSRGRRREGGESEPQRPNMSRRLFTSALLLLVVMMCCGSGGAQAAEPASEPKFEWKDVTEGDVTVDSLVAPGLLNLGSDVFAVAEAQCKNNDKSVFTGIAFQLLTMDKDKEKEEVMKDARVTQFLEEGTSEDAKKKVDVSRPTTVMKGNDIYMLVGKYSRTDTADAQESGGGDSGLLLVEGEVSEESGSGKRIKWKNNNAVSKASLGEQLISWTELIGSGGSGVKMHDDTLVFFVEGTKKENKDGEPNDGKTVSLLIYSSEDTTEIWKLSKGMSEGGCSDPSVVEWKDKKLIMMAACDGGRRRVYESGDKGDSWTGHSGHSRACGATNRVKK